MENLVKTGKTKAIGVSNYSKSFLEDLLPHCSILPAVNQIENRECYVAPYGSEHVLMATQTHIYLSKRLQTFVRRKVS